MDQRLHSNPRINSKKVYFINGKAFTSDKGTKNGKAKAEKYCYDNLLNSKDIIVFDSEMEFKYYLFLLKKQKEGVVSNIELHKNFLLLDAFTANSGAYHERMIYEADFVYEEYGKKIVVDTKGFVEEVFYLKWKLFDYLYKSKGLALKVVRLKGKDYLNESSWVEIKDYVAPKKTIKKQKEEIKKLRAEKHKEEVLQNKTKKEVARYQELTNKSKLNSAERKRLEQLKEILINKGLIL